MSKPTLVNTGLNGLIRSRGKSAIFCVHGHAYSLLHMMQRALAWVQLDEPMDFSGGLGQQSIMLYFVWLRDYLYFCIFCPK